VLVELDDGAHRLSHRVERVDLEEPFLGHLVSVVLVVQAEVVDETEQRTLGLVADLLRQLASGRRRLCVKNRTGIVPPPPGARKQSIGYDIVYS